MLVRRLPTYRVMRQYALPNVRLNMRVRKPCPGCGRSDVGRKAENVCSDCAESIKLGTALRGKEDKAATFSIPRADWWPKFYHRDGNAEGLGELFGETVHAIVKKPKTKQFSNQRIPTSARNGGTHSWWEAVILSKTGAQYIDRLDQEIRKALDNAFIEGFRKGNDMLVRLAAGELTNDKFSDQVLEHTKPKDRKTHY